MSDPPPGWRRLSLTKGFAATGTAVAGLVTAAIGVLFLLVPELKPLTRDKISASVAVTDIENHVSAARWARLQYPKHHAQRLRDFLGDDASPDDHRALGSIIYVRLRTDGFKRRSIRLRATLYNAQTRTPSRAARATVTFPDSGKLSIDTPSASSIQLLFVSDVGIAIPGRYYFRVAAFDDSGILAYADSRPFEEGRFL